MVPQINTAAEAAEVVRLAKFPPLGARGQGSPFAALAHGVPTPQYLKQANDTLITMIQIETVEGLKNVREIAAVPGVGECDVTYPTGSLRSHPLPLSPLPSPWLSPTRLSPEMRWVLRDSSRVVEPHLASPSLTSVTGSGITGIPADAAPQT
jgi:hypothetical protein